MSLRRYGYGKTSDDNPCYECTERTMCCHSTCEKYHKWKDDRRQKRKGLSMQINPPQCKYFKEHCVNSTAPKSKRRYR